VGPRSHRRTSTQALDFFFIYIFGDNGPSVIGDLNGTFVEWSALNGTPEDVPTC